MASTRCQLRKHIQEKERELQVLKQKMTQIGENVAESPCAKKARIGIPPVWSNAERTLQSPAANLNSILFSPSPSPGMRKGRSHVIANSDEVKVENEKLIAAVASPMRRRSSLGAEDLESDAVEPFGNISNFEAKLTAATALSLEGAPPVKKARIEDACPPANDATPQASKKELLTPASAVPWTPDQRVLLREKIQALRLLSTDRDTSPSPSSNESSPGSSRSASPRTSRSASPHTPERARLFHGASPPQKLKEEVDFPPPPPPGSPDCDGASVPPPPPPGSPGCDSASVPPPPPPGSPPSDTTQPVPPSPTTPVRQRCVWPGIRAEKASSSPFETASDVEADIRRLIALHAVANVFADSIFA